MNMGGDDFIAKPFDMEVLTAKIQALLRRTYAMTPSAAHLVDCHGVILNTDDATLTYEGQKIELTKNDYKLLFHAHVPSRRGHQPRPADSKAVGI